MDKGTRWAMGTRWSLNIYDCKWLPQLDPFKLITPKNPNCKPSLGRWLDWLAQGGMEHICNKCPFLATDADAILSIPLSPHWLSGKLTWHFLDSGELTVRSTYHLIVRDQNLSMPGRSSLLLSSFWMGVWDLQIRSWMWMFLCHECSNVLPLKEALAKRVPNIHAKCYFCCKLTDSNIHDIFECM